MRISKLCVPLLLTAAVCLTACTKTGPQGPQGDKGDTGDTGATGATGAKGDTGTANVIYSDWQPLDYNATSVSGLYRADWTGITELTNDIMDNGLILTYVKQASSSLISPLPYLSSSGDGKIWVPGIQVNRIIFYTTIYSPFVSDKVNYRYRYIIVPGGVSARLPAPPDYKDYQAVCRYFRIPE